MYTKSFVIIIWIKIYRPYYNIFSPFLYEFFVNIKVSYTFSKVAPHFLCNLPKLSIYCEFLEIWHNILGLGIDKQHKIWYNQANDFRLKETYLYMNVQGYQKLTLLDYPGHTAATIFLGGCNLRCPFCHNAGLVKTPMAEANAEADVLAYLSKRKGILDGVCVTGGEPLLHPDLPELLSKLKDMGYLVKLDTNGALPHKLSAILSTGLVDMVAMDIKHAPLKYPLATGCDLDFSPFAESMRVLRESGLPFEFRTTVVKGIHEKEDIVTIATLVGDDPYFLQKFVDSGNLLGTGCSAFSELEMQDILVAVKAVAPKTILRG